MDIHPGFNSQCTGEDVGSDHGLKIRLMIAHLVCGRERPTFRRFP